MNYVEVTCSLKPQKPYDEIMIAHLADLGFESFQETDSGFKAYISGENFDKENLEAFSPFAEGENVEFSFSIKKINESNWNQIWESNFEPILIGNCYIRATFHTPRKDVDYEIVIEPKMSFGTGHHETTSLMVKWLLEINMQNMNVLDMGCGTGILAILASKRGAESVLAIDNYIYAYENTLENIKRNDCSNIKALSGDASLLDGKQLFDIIIANITKNVLIEDMPHYSNSMNNKGLLLVSGFFDDDKNELIKRAEQFDLSVIGEKAEDKWMSLCFRKK